MVDSARIVQRSDKDTSFAHRPPQSASRTSLYDSSQTSYFVSELASLGIEQRRFRTKYQDQCFSHIVRHVC